MSKFYVQLKSIGAFFLAVCLGITAYIFYSFPFVSGSKTQEYYLYSTSSNAKIQDGCAFYETPFLKGQAVTYENQSAENLLETYHAKVRFCERAESAVSYYAYSPCLRKGTVLDGYEINLHIVEYLGENTVVVGFPIIFGGY